MSALEKKKKENTRASVKQKCGLGSPPLALERVSEDGANCGGALAVLRFSIRCQRLFVCACSGAVHSLTCLFAHSFSSSRDSRGNRPAVRLPNKPDLVPLGCHFSSAKQLRVAQWPVVGGGPSLGSGVLNWSGWIRWFRNHCNPRQRKTPV